MRLLGALRLPAVIGVRDLRAAFSRPVGYGVTAGFLALAGVVLTLALRAGEARLDGWFAPLFVLTGVLAALLTMRSFAEEEAAGSLEVLVTAPVRTWQLVLGKLLGVVAVFLVIVAGTLAAPVLLSTMGDPDSGPILTGYVGFVLVGVSFLCVGVALSAATASQLVAGAATVGLLMALWFGSALSSVLGGTLGSLVEYLSPSTHVTGFLRGTLAVTDVVYFASLAVAGFASAVGILGARR